MNRRSFLSTLAALPVVGRWFGKSEPLVKWSKGPATDGPAKLPFWALIPSGLMLCDVCKKYVAIHGPLGGNFCGKCYCETGRCGWNHMAVKPIQRMTLDELADIYGYPKHLRSK